MLNAGELAALGTRRAVREFLARAVDNLSGGSARAQLPADLAGLATGSDREVIESCRVLEQWQGARLTAPGASANAAIGRQLRELFSQALRRMKQLPPDPRGPAPSQAPAATDGAPTTHLYGVARLTNGEHEFEVWSRKRVEAHRDRYAKSSGEDSAWATAFNAMGKKTLAIQLAKWLPMEVEIQQQIARAEAASVGLDVHDVVDLGDAPEAPEEKKPSKLDALTESMTSAARGAPPEEASGSTPTTVDPAADPAPASPDTVVDAIHREWDRWEPPPHPMQRTSMFKHMGIAGDPLQAEPLLLQDILDQLIQDNAMRTPAMDALRADVRYTAKGRKK